MPNKTDLLFDELASKCLSLEASGGDVRLSNHTTLHVDEKGSGLDHLMEVRIGDKWYGLVHSLYNVAEAAADGLLGDQLVPRGEYLRAVASRKRLQRTAEQQSEAEERARKHLRELWGIHWQDVWDMRTKVAHDRAVAKAVRLMKWYGSEFEKADEPPWLNSLTLDQRRAALDILSQLQKKQAAAAACSK